MDLREELVSSETIYAGKVVNLRLETVRLPNGRTALREVVEHRGAVAIVALRDADTLLMIRQYRRAVDEELVEIPAGTLERGEPIEQCAIRELEEETGYRAGTLRHLFSQYMAPGYSQEVLHVFIAQDLERSVPHTDEDETVQVIAMPIETVTDMIADGQIRDAKTIAGVLMALRVMGR